MRKQKSSELIEFNLLKHPFFILKLFDEGNGKVGISAVLIAPKDSNATVTPKLVIENDITDPISSRMLSESKYYDVIHSSFPMNKIYFENTIDLSFDARDGVSKKFQLIANNGNDIVANYYWLSRNHFPFPDKNNIYRVAGNVGLPSFYSKEVPGL